MRRAFFLLILFSVAVASFADVDGQYWVEGDRIFPPFETIYISDGLKESWAASDQLDWVIGRKDILDRLNPIWINSTRQFSAAPWLYEGRGLWTVLVDGVVFRSLLLPSLAQDYVRSLDPALIDSVELEYGGDSGLYGYNSALGAVGVSLPRASFSDRLGGASELFGRASTLEREESAWWRASLFSPNLSALGEIAGRRWENDDSDTLTREQFIGVFGQPSSSLNSSFSFLARHLNNLESDVISSDFDSQQASLDLDYKRAASGLTDIHFALLGVNLEDGEDPVNSVERWQWVGGRALSGFEAGRMFRTVVGFDGFWERADYDEVRSGEDKADAASGAGFMLLELKPAEKFELVPGFRYDVARDEDEQYEFVSPSLKISYAASDIWNFIASYDHSNGGNNEHEEAWDSWKFGVKITDERVRAVAGVGYIDSEKDSPYSFGRMRIFLGYNWRFDFSSAWVRWDEDDNNLFGHCAVRFAGTEHDWWVEWISMYAANRELSGFFWRHDLFARFQFFRYLSLRAGVENLLDRRYRIELMKFEPRNYKFQLEFAFEI